MAHFERGRARNRRPLIVEGAPLNALQQLAPNIPGDGNPYFSPDTNFAVDAQDAMDPSKAPGPVKTLASMTPGEVAALEKLYGCRIKPREG